MMELNFEVLYQAFPSNLFYGIYDHFQGVYAMGFSAPSKIQETALPTLLADPPQNMIAQSQSGTGKTAAFVLAMLSRVDRSKNHPQVRFKCCHVDCEQSEKS